MTVDDAVLSDYRSVGATVIVAFGGVAVDMTFQGYLPTMLSGPQGMLDIGSGSVAASTTILPMKPSCNQTC